jgi:hypothetical protein
LGGICLSTHGESGSTLGAVWRDHYRRRLPAGR